MCLEKPPVIEQFDDGVENPEYKSRVAGYNAVKREILRDLDH